MNERKKSKFLLVLNKNNIKRPNKSIILNTEQLQLNTQEETTSSNNKPKVNFVSNKSNLIQTEKRTKSIIVNKEIIRQLKSLEKKEINKKKLQKRDQEKQSDEEKKDSIQDSFNIIQLHTRESFFIPDSNKNFIHNMNNSKKNNPSIIKRNTLAIKPRIKSSKTNIKIDVNCSPTLRRTPELFQNIFNKRQLTQNFQDFTLFENVPNIQKTNNVQQKKRESQLSDDFIPTVIRNNKIQYMNKIKEKIIDVNINDRIKYFLKDPILKKKDNLFKKIRKYSLIQSIFSVISIILCIIDMELYNIFSEQYIIKNSIKYDEYYKIRYRTISSAENTIRIFNFLCSLICGIMTICIYLTKVIFNKTEEAKILRHKNNVQNIHILFELLNSHLKGHKNYITCNSKIKLAIRFLINIFFYPPILNFCFKSSFYNVIYLFPFQIFVLVISICKLYNVYRCIFYFIPYTGNLGEDICKKYKIRLNIKFIFRGFLNKNKLLFPVIIIIISLVTLLLHSIEFFAVDLSLVNNSTEIYFDINNHNMTRNFSPNFYLDILWLYLSTLSQHSFSDYIPKTPIGKIVFLFFHITGFFFLCIIFLRIDKIINLDPNGLKAFTKLIKIFKPENKENKAADLIRSFLLVKKYYSLYYVDINKVRDNFREIRRSTNFDGHEIRKIMRKKLLKMKNKKILFISSKFLFFSKYFTELRHFHNVNKISRKQPLDADSLIQNIQDKMSKNSEILNYKTTYLSYIDNIYKRLKNNDKLILNKIKKIKKYNESILAYLIERSNISYQKKQKITQIKSMFINNECVFKIRSHSKKIKYNSVDITKIINK